MPCNSNFGQNFELEFTLNLNFELEITLDYFFKLQLTSNYSLNYTETYFELDSKEATAVSVASFYSFVCTEASTTLT